jgi:hypothetical protein
MGGRGITWASIILAALAVGGFAWWLLYHGPSDEDRIRIVVADLKRGVEEKDPQRVVALISSDYRDDFALRRKDLAFLLLRALRTDGRFEVTIRRERIKVTGRDATATLDGEVTLSQGPETVGRYAGVITLLLRKEGRAWKLTGTRGWQGRLLQGLVGLD